MTHAYDPHRRFTSPGKYDLDAVEQAIWDDMIDHLVRFGQ